MMLKNTTMTKEKEGERRKLNNSEDLQINRGFELMLRNNDRREKPSVLKAFQFRFGKMLSLLRREIHFQIDFFFDIKKK